MVRTGWGVISMEAVPESIRQVVAASLAGLHVTRNQRQALAEAVAGPEEGASRAVRAMAFDLARGTAGSVEAGPLLDWVEAIVEATRRPRDRAVVGGAEAHFSPGTACYRRIIGLFDKAEKSADVCVFTITDDRISAAILDAHARGVAIRVVADNEKAEDLGSDVGRLAAAGVPVRVDRTPFHMHHKFALFDGRLLLNGSYNWTRGAADSNEENILITPDPDLVRPFATAFERLWESLA